MEMTDRIFRPYQSNKMRNKRKDKSNANITRLCTLLAAAFLTTACVQQYTDRQKEALLSVVSKAVAGTATERVVTDGMELPAPLAQGREELVLERTGYTASYNKEWKMPNWVAWKLTAGRLNGKARRTNEFLPDPDVPQRHSAESRDYATSRYDRGHMAPAGDMKWSQVAMDESFYLSNICPQASNLNQGDWRILEERCRVWAKSMGDLYIVCGPIVYPDVKHKRIGRNKVTVPDGFFKVILLTGRRPCAVGFLYPNDDCDAPLSAYAVAVDSVEAVTGIDFFPRLDDEVESRIEAVNAISEFVR